MAEKRLEYIISARDQTAAATRTAQTHLQQVAAAAKGMATVAAASSAQSRGALGTLQTAAGRTGSSFAALAKSTQSAMSSMAKSTRTAATAIHRDLSKAHAAASKLTAAAGGLARSMEKFGVGAGVAGGALVGAFAGMGVSSNKFKQNTLATLEVLTRSKKEAASLYQFFSKFADVSPFDDEEVVSAGKALLTFGFNARKQLQLVSDTAAAMGVPLEQVVRVMAKLKAGSFDMAESGVIGITREDLEKHGVTFKSSGEPENPKQLLPAAESFLRGRFGGATEARQSGFDAQFSTMISNLRRLAQSGTTGLFKSLTTAFGKASEALAKFLEIGGGDKLRRPFDLMGRAVEAAAAQLPRFLGWVLKIADAGLWSRLKSLAVDAWRTIGGTIAGVANVLWEAIRGQKAGVDSFNDMGEGVKNFAATAVRALGRVVRAVLFAVAAYGGLQVAIGAAARNPAMMLEGGVRAAGGYLAMMGAGRVSEGLAREVEGLDTTTQGRRQGAPGWRGAFARGFVGFNQETDRFLGAMRGAGAGATVPGTGGVATPTLGSAPGQQPGRLQPAMGGGTSAPGKKKNPRDPKKRRGTRRGGGDAGDDEDDGAEASSMSRPPWTNNLPYIAPYEGWAGDPDQLVFLPDGRRVSRRWARMMGLIEDEYGNARKITPGDSGIPPVTPRTSTVNNVSGYSIPRPINPSAGDSVSIGPFIINATDLERGPGRAIVLDLVLSSLGAALDRAGVR
ncbi:MAG: hypothetical protein Q7R40_00335 [Phaeospirillum sp.]|nr:hypothetical protein [Phaeospirillum sp.]